MPLGALTTAAFKREDTVFSKVYPGSPAVATANDMLPLQAVDVNSVLDQQSQITRSLPSLPQQTKTLRESSDGNLTLSAVYSGLEFFFTCVLGVEANEINGTEMPEELVAGQVYRHLIELDDDVRLRPWEAGTGFVAGTMPLGDGLIAGQRKVRRGTLVENRGYAVWETVSAMLQGMTLQATPPAVLISSEVLGYETTLASTANGGFGSLQCPDFERIRFREVEIYLREQGTGPIDRGSDRVGDIVGLQLVVANQLQGVATRGRGGMLAEPRRRDTALVNGTFALPVINSNDLLVRNKDATPQIGLIEFIGGEIGATGFNYTLRFWMPLVTLTGADAPTSGPERQAQNYAFECDKPLTNPDGFPDNTQGGSLMIELINDVSAHPLLD